MKNDLIKKSFSESRYMEHPDGVFSTSLDGKIVVFNSILTSLVGYSAEEISEISIKNLISSKSLKSVLRRFVAAKRGRYQRYVAEMVTKDRLRVEVFVAHIPIFHSGEIVGVHCIFYDIKDAKRYVVEIEEKNHLNELLMNSLPYPAMIIDSNKKIIVANSIAKEKGAIIGGICWREFGRQTSTSEEQCLVSKNNNESTQCFFCKADECLSGKITCNDTDVKIGESIFNVFWIPLEHAGLYLHYAIDVTSHRAAEKAVIESQRLSAIGEMAAGIAHDFRNVLQSIFGNIDLAIREPNQTLEMTECLNSIKKSAIDGAERIKQLQKFASAKRSNDEFLLVDLNEVIRDVVVQSRPMWKDSCQKSGIVIRIENDLGELPKIMGNEGELRSSFYNIVKNAIESMSQGGIVKIRGTVLFDEKMISIEISDSGCGMEEEIVKRLFQPFFSTKGLEGGRGLGMSSVLGIMKAHDGTAIVKSTKINQGSVIEVKLPFITEEKAVIVPTESEKTLSKKARILWVDDDEYIRKASARTLREMEHDGIFASSGAQALDLIRQDCSFDLIITDIGMPMMDGWSLIKAIHEEHGDKFKIVVLSGWGDKIKSPHAGAQPYLIACKPISYEELSDIIQKAIA